VTVDAERDRGRGVAEALLLLDDTRMDCPFENVVG